MFGDRLIFFARPLPRSTSARLTARGGGLPNLSYDVTALIGEVGMGQVYQITDTKLNRQVAC